MDTDLAETEARLAGPVNTLRVIVAAMVLGVLTFAGIAAVVTAGRDEPAEPDAVAAEVGDAEVVVDPDPDVPLLNYAALAAAAGALLAYRPVGAAVTGGAGGDDEEGRAVGLFTTRTIVRCAILEGAAMLCVVFQLVEPWWPVWLAVGALVLALLGEFPTVGRLRRYLETRRQLAALAPRGEE